jgi:hypothetical protein
MMGCKTIKHGNLTFILSSKVVVKSSMQSFYLEPTKRQGSARITLIKSKIESGDIKTLSELATACETKVRWTTYYG